MKGMPTGTAGRFLLETVYLVHHSHMDIGYTDLADEVREQHLRHLDLALELCDQPPASTEGGQFCWTIESSWIVADYLRLRPAGQVERLFAALRRGQLELEASFVQPLTELAVAEETIDSVRFAAELGRQYGFPVACAMLNDIGGFMGRLPSILNGWNVRYLVAGVGAYQVHMPWADLPHLFYLQDKAGGRILIWNLGIDRTCTPQTMKFLDAVYYMGGTYLMTSQPPHSRYKGTAEAFAALVRRLQAEGYPYGELMLQYATDNGGPNPHLLSLLETLRGGRNLPHIELATPLRFFRTVEERHAGQIPVLSGIITDPWVLRANPQPAPLAEHRTAQRRLLAAEARRVQARRVGDLASSDSRSAWDSLHCYADHTCGLSEWDWPQKWEKNPGCRAAAFDRYRRSWRDKAHYADMALRRANNLDRDARERVLADLLGTEPAIIIWNDQPHPETGLAEVTVPSTQQASRLKSLHDPATGKPTRFQRVAANTYLIEAVAVPSLGYRVLMAEWEEDPQPWMDSSSHTLPTCPAALESDQLVLSLDPATGAIRQVQEKGTNRTWLTGSSPNGLGEFQYAQVTNVSPTTESSGMAGGINHQWVNGKLGRVWCSVDGPLVTGLARERVFELPGRTVRVTEELRLYPGQRRIDFRYRIDKPETAEKEACYIWFGLDLPEAVFRCDQAVGWIEPRRDLLAGAMQDAFYATQWADLSTSARGATLVCHESPLIQVGRLRTYEWRDTRPFVEDGSALIAWPYHNLQQTDNPIWQDLLLNVQYSLCLHEDSGFDPVRCDRDAAAALVPLRGQLVNVRPGVTASRSGIVLESKTVRWIGCHLLPDSQTICVRLEERAGQDAEAVLSFDEEVEWTRKTATFFGGENDGLLLKPEGRRLRVPLGPFELATVLVRFRE
jgi:hypothetical protein